MVYVDDNIVTHPKLLEAGARLGPHGTARALSLYVAGLAYCARHLTDGRIPVVAVPVLLADADLEAVAGVLVEVGLWDRQAADYLVHDYLHWNRSREQVQAARARTRERVQAARARTRERVPQPRQPGPQGNARRTTVTHDHCHDGAARDHTHTEDYDQSQDHHHVQRGGAAPHAAEASVVSAREPSPEAACWELWRATASASGAPPPLTPSPTEWAHLQALVASYGPDDLAAAVRVWWGAPTSRTGGRSLGLFRSQVGELLAHARTGAPPSQYRARSPSMAQAAEAAMALAERLSASGRSALEALEVPTVQRDGHARGGR